MAVMQSGARPRAALIGCGYISEYHVAALRRAPAIEIVGVHDRDEGRARALADRFGLAVLPSLGALRDAGADVIHVLTPPDTHAAIAIEALELGCHVFVEKPLATDVDDCVRVARAARERGLHAGVCHSLLFDPQVRRVLEVVRAGALGRVVAVDILRSSVYPPYAGGPLPPQYRTPGYPFRDLGIHALYVLEALLGPIENVEARWASLGGDPNLVFDEWRALVRCRDGAGQFQLSWNVKPIQHQLLVQGTRGVLRADLFLLSQGMRRSTPLPKAAERLWNGVADAVGSLATLGAGAVGFARGRVRPYHGLQELVRAFYEAIERGARPPVTAEDAIAATRWTEQIARAADADAAHRRRRFATGPSIPVVVTGASGGLGSALVERLRAEGRRVRVFVRREPDRLPEGVEVAFGDLADPEAVRRALEGAEVVYHIGAAMKGGAAEHEGATVAGTRNVIEACRERPPRLLVHTSSLSVIDWAGAPDFAPVDEDTPDEPRPAERGVYTRAKLEAERMVRSAAREGALRAVIVRPGQIFGRRIPVLTPAVARRLGGRLVVLGDGELPLPLVYIDDVVDALLAAERGPLKAGEVIQIVDPEVVTQNEVLAAVAGAGARVIRVPRRAVFAAGKASELLLAPLGRASPLGTYRLRSALALRRFSAARAQQLLGWHPRVGVREGLKRAATGAG
jgi:predicted dehydrogenase/nucleoside-diphosphate-sugar epimerase